MDQQGTPKSGFPFRATAASGISMEINSNGSIRRMDHGDIMLNLFPGSEIEGGPVNIHLRENGGRSTHALLGSGSGSQIEPLADGMWVRGVWNGLAYRVRLILAESLPAWFWHVEIENTTDREVVIDLIHTQDLGLAHYGAIRLNEFYVSQYVDHTPLTHPAAGWVVASRQNQSMGGRCPWSIVGSLGKAISYATDAYQFHGLATRAGSPAEGLVRGLPGRRLQHEHSMVGIQDESVTLAPGERTARGFFGGFKPDLPRATETGDAAWVSDLLALPEASAPDGSARSGGRTAPDTVFAGACLLETLDLDDSEVSERFGGSPRHVEREGGNLWSFFTGDNQHVVFKAKELSVLRPHGMILRSGGVLTADESVLTSTCWMNGVFHSMVTQGHVSINRFLSTCHSYLGLFRSHGLRVFARIDGGWKLLDVPSAFEMAPDRCRWIYKHAGGLIEVVSEAPDKRQELGLRITVLKGPPIAFLLSMHVAMNGDDGNQPHPVLREDRDGGIFVRAIADSDVGRRFPDGGFLIKAAPDTSFEKIGGDECLFKDGKSRNQPFLCVLTKPAPSIGLVVEGRLVESRLEHDAAFWEGIPAGLRIDGPEGSPASAAADRLADFFPWLIHNAFIHYLSPRGLEQYSGGGWGTRDVCQGPLELLLALGRTEPVRDLLLRVFKQQNSDGDWPQWFMFFDRERNIRPGDSHGDIVYWPLLALAEYLTASGDASILGERVPFFQFEEGGDPGGETILHHVERALEVILGRVIAGTNLAAYGHGDWNDSLQPAKPDMRERLCSSWTVTLNYQTFIALASAFRRLGDAERAAQFETMAGNILEEFQSLLVVDDVVAGLAYFHEGGKTDLMLHPRDKGTGLSYSLLPMIHAVINDMFTLRQAEAHLGLIREHLSGPDGARLFDRPMAYHGGIQTNFQRAESASFFGREIGIMYTHAHLRWCEALARFGDADGFFKGLCQFNPIQLREAVPSARPRQANCYYSSSDAVFADRYEAFDRYARVITGEVPIEGGWRVYSSGAGIGVRMIMQCFIGIRWEDTAIVLDPVVTKELHGMKARLVIAGKTVEILYQIEARGRGPVSVNLNGEDLDFIHEPNPYRTGGARISKERFERGLTEEINHLTIWLE